MNRVKKILIIRLSSIGDILLTTPFVRQLRSKFKEAQIDYVIKNEFTELLKFNQNINNIIDFDIKNGFGGLKRLKDNLSQNEYDYIFDLHNNLRSNYLKKNFKDAKKYRIKKNKFIQFLYVKFKINYYRDIIPISERYLKVGKSVGIEDDGGGPEIFWNNDFEKKTNEKLRKKGLTKNRRFFIIAPGAGFYTKRWPTEYYKILAKNILEKYQCNIVVLGDNNDSQQGSVLAEMEGVIDLTGHLSLLESAIVLSRSRALVSNDTGLMHMATAVKKPVLAIFGSTVKEFGFYPYRSQSVVVDNPNLSCRPCSHIGRNSCPKKHFRCMREIYPSVVFNKFEELLAN